MDSFMNNLERFVRAQEHSYAQALSEINAGRKDSHWIWYIFPQLKGLGRSYNSDYYGLDSVAEAVAYLAHPVLAPRLREITMALLEHSGRTPMDILGNIDARKVCSSMTLFEYVCPNDVFTRVIDEFYNGHRCKRTLRMIAASGIILS
jgi:uncharacterized protein (DUF1810 family)